MKAAPAGFRSLRVERFLWRLRADINVDLLLPILRNPEEFLSNPAQHIKNSAVVTIARVPGSLILRRLNYGKFIHCFRDAFRPSRAQRALDAAALLEAANVNTPRALAACDVRILRWPRAAYLITEEVSGAFTLAGLFHAEGTIRPELLRKLASLIARLHNQGISHRDLKWTNILFDQNFGPWLIDLDGVRKFQRVSDHQARLDIFSLIRCFVPHKEVHATVAGFLKAYCEERRPAADFDGWGVELGKWLLGR
jgi:tRNA A-37 threonylcarbamoyl transferase component Bud32